MNRGNLGIPEMSDHTLPKEIIQNFYPWNERAESFILRYFQDHLTH